MRIKWGSLVSQYLLVLEREYNTAVTLGMLGQGFSININPTSVNKGLNHSLKTSDVVA